jgi:hypothetical protein
MIAGSVLFFTMAEYEATSLLVESVSEGFDNVAVANFEKSSLRPPNTSFKFPRISLYFVSRNFSKPSRSIEKQLLLQLSHFQFRPATKFRYWQTLMEMLTHLMWKLRLQIPEHRTRCPVSSLDKAPDRHRKG